MKSHNNDLKITPEATPALSPVAESLPAKPARARTRFYISANGAVLRLDENKSRETAERA